MVHLKVARQNACRSIMTVATKAQLEQILKILEGDPNVTTDHTCPSCHCDLSEVLQFTITGPHFIEVDAGIDLLLLRHEDGKWLGVKFKCPSCGSTLTAKAELCLYDVLVEISEAEEEWTLSL